MPSVALAVPKRVMSLDKRKTISGRNRWSSYELRGAAAPSLTAPQNDVEDDAAPQNDVEDDEVPEPTAAPVDNQTVVSQSRSTDTVSSGPVLQTVPSQDAPHEMVPDISVTEDSTVKERHRSRDDEILGNIFTTMFRSLVCLNLLFAISTMVVISIPAWKTIIILPCFFYLKRRRRRPANGTQQNFATCSAVGPV